MRFVKGGFQEEDLPNPFTAMILKQQERGSTRNFDEDCQRKAIFTIVNLEIRDGQNIDHKKYFLIL